ncbi:MAG: amino acid transporter [Dehalococcoidia bacterium]
MPAEYVWDALTPVQARELFRAFTRPWWVAGGWALDLHLGRETRRHEDIDLAMLRGDEIALAEMLPGWDICIAEAGALIPWHGERPLDMPYHQFWVRRERDGPWRFEVLLEDHDGAGAWRCRRDHRVTLPIKRVGRVSSDGIPYVAPEIALLYKAKGHEIAKNAADFTSTLPSLDEGARRWLRDALDVAHAEHPWLKVL